MPEESTLETSAAPEAAAPEAQSAPEAAPVAAPASGTPPAAARTFTEDQVQGMIRDRLKTWQKYGKPEELDARLSRAQQIEQWRENLQRQVGQPGAAPGQRTSEAPLTDDDKKVIAYMDRIYPGFSKTREAMQQIQEQQAQFERYRWDSIAKNNEAYLKDLAKSSGYDEAHLGELSNRVAHSIMGNREDYAAYLQGNGNPEIIKRHFENLDKFLKGFKPAAPPAAAGAAYAAAKGATTKLPPRMPPAGVPAPTAAKKPLNDKERIDKAFEQFTKS